MGKKKNNRVIQPDHYMQWEFEPFTWIMLNNLPFAEGSIIKYVSRWRKKNGVEDLKKARRILDMMIDLEENRDQFIAERTAL